MRQIWFSSFAFILLSLAISIRVSKAATINVQNYEDTSKARIKREDMLPEYIEDCGYYYNMEQARNLTFASPGFDEDSNYPSSFDCTWTFVGTTRCTPHLYCDTVDLRRNQCEDRLVISDGIGGWIEICGSREMSRPVKASSGARDLFVKFSSGDSQRFNRHYEGFRCTVKCARAASGSAVSIPFVGLQRQEDSSCFCGVYDDDGRVVGGETARRNEFPWQVAIVPVGTRKPICGGSIINNMYILTAVHCFHFTKKQAKDIEVLIHAHLLDFTITKKNASLHVPLGQLGSMQGPGFDLPKVTDEQENTQRFKVVEIVKHPLFTEKFDFDVALLRLDGEINFKTAQAAPICLPVPGEYDDYEERMSVVSGWGLAAETSGASTRLLQKLEIPVIPYSDCKRDIVPHKLTNRMLCAGYLEGVKDACMGDSGGPLSLKMRNRQWQQIGIVSWGEGCARKSRPGIYSRVTEFTQWITRHSNHAGVSWCRS